MKFQTVDPATEKVIAEYALHSDKEVEGFIAQSAGAYQEWRKASLAQRVRCVSEFANAMHGARAILAETITREMGKTLKDAQGEVDKCVASCKTLVEQFPKWHAELAHAIPGGYSVTREPLGVILGIMPWNFPLWQAVRFVIPTFLCGNTVLLKHAPNTWGTAEFMETLFNQAFPENLYFNLKVDVPAVGRILADRRVHGVSLTGSVRAGKSIGALAGQHLKKCVLELGGSDAYVVLDDADVGAAAEASATGRMINGGQSCIAAKRFIVTKKNAAEFTDKMHAALAKKKFGDPMHSTTDFGPMARKDLRDQLHEQVERSVAKGAKLALGGKAPEQTGFYYPASLLTGVKPGQAAFDEELFGPVAAVIEAKDEGEAFQLANNSCFGLGGAVFSRDVERAKALATSELEAGMVFVNDFVRSDAIAPFGGIKDSGLGRELGKEGCFEFTNIKTVFVR